MECSICNAENQNGYQFCGNCGDRRQIAVTDPNQRPILNGATQRRPVPPNGRRPADTRVEPTPHNTQWQGKTTASDTTRYLCAATYLKPGLARRIRPDIIDENDRAPGPGGGVDTGSILAHATAAPTYEAMRDLGMVIALIVGIIGIARFAPLVPALHANPNYESAGVVGVFLTS